MYNFRSNNRFIKKNNPFGNSRKFSGATKSKSATKVFARKPKCTPVQFVSD